MPVATSTALLIAAGVAAVGTGAAIVQGEQQRKSAKKGFRAQEEAQRRGLAQQRSAERTAGQRERAANRRQPNIGSILSNAFSSSGGINSTFLTGSRPGGTPLGQSSTLG